MAMRNRIILTIETVAIFVLIAIIAFQQHRYVELETAAWERYWIKDSLASLNDIRELNQVEYYHMQKDSILNLLPNPTSDKIWTFTGRKKELDLYNWPARHIVNKFKKSDTDTVIMNAVFWELPYNRLPDLYIGFVKDSTGHWIAEYCLQWDDRTTKID